MCYGSLWTWTKPPVFQTLPAEMSVHGFLNSSMSWRRIPRYFLRSTHFRFEIDQQRSKGDLLYPFVLCICHNQFLAEDPTSPYPLLTSVDVKGTAWVEAFKLISHRAQFGPTSLRFPCVCFATSHHCWLFRTWVLVSSSFVIWNSKLNRRCCSSGDWEAKLRLTLLRMERFRGVDSRNFISRSAAKFNQYS